MQKPCWLIGLALGMLCLPAASQLRADPVVFSNLGAGESYIGVCTCGWGVGNSWYGSVAVPFTPSVSGDLSQILVALANFGTNNGTLELVDNNAGAPTGSVLESWAVAGLPSLNSASTIQPSQTFTSTAPVFLSSGTQYWILAETPSEFIWMPNVLGEYQVDGQFPVCSNGCTNEFNTQYAPAFEVTVTPEP